MTYVLELCLFYNTGLNKLVRSIVLSESGMPNNFLVSLSCPQDMNQLLLPAALGNHASTQCTNQSTSPSPLTESMYRENKQFSA